MSSFRTISWGLMLAAALSGCAHWTPAKFSEVNKLPTPPLPPDSVVLEIAFARLPLDDRDAYDEIWQRTDEQIFDTDIRRQWADNGLRCGIVGSQLPTKLREILERNSSSLEDLAADAMAVNSESSRADRRIQCRSGRRAKVYTSSVFDELALLTQQEGTVRGWPLSQAQCLFGLKAYPQGDSGAKIVLIPEVEHGEMKTQYVGREGSVMPQLGRERVELDSLALDATLSPGQVLMISGTPEPKGLGQHFFVEQSGNSKVHSLLLIRLAVSQHDDLFAPDQIAAPLATPTEE